ncbi:MAG: hypothetical protein IPK10_00700 [Bacteroidetes bacterium]|nr:hypothetical protein [Bacteroidota bacterium]
MNVIIGDISIPNSGNVFNDVNNSIVIKDGGRYKISVTIFGGKLGQNFLMLECEITGADIEITNNGFIMFKPEFMGTIFIGSKLDIGNHFTDPEPTVGNPNFVILPLHCKTNSNLTTKKFE